MTINESRVKNNHTNRKEEDIGDKKRARKNSKEKKRKGEQSEGRKAASTWKQGPEKKKTMSL